MMYLFKLHYFDQYGEFLYDRTESLPCKDSVDVKTYVCEHLWDNSPLGVTPSYCCAVPLDSGDPVLVGWQ